MRKLILTLIFLPTFLYPQTNLTSNSSFDDQNPTFSPDGQSILFDSKRNGGAGNLNIWIMQVNGANPIALTSGDDDNVSMPGSSWNEATNRICFASDRTGNEEIWVMNSDGTNPAQITNNTAPDWEPTFSPDGQWIVFQSNRDGNWEIYKVNVQTLQVTRLTNKPADDWEPNWSPIGDKIVFQSFRDGNWEIYTMDTFGNNLINETNNNSEDTDPSWSTDGKKIVYSSDYGGMSEADIFVRDTSTSSSPTQLTFDPAYDGAPSFSHDGSMVAFESSRSGNLDIWLLSLPLGVEENSNTYSNSIEVNIFPNPANDKISAELKSTSFRSDIKIYNLLGQILFDMNNIHEKTFTIDIKNLISGIYFIVVETSNKTIIQKFIKY